MSEVVCGIGMSHAPGILGWPDAPSPEARESIASAVGSLRSYLAERHPDVLIAFLDDHFDNHFRNLMPIFSLGIADAHRGPAPQYLEMLKIDHVSEIPSRADIGEQLLEGLVHSGFDVARMGRVDYGNNLMVPLQLIRPELDIPIVPVFINVFTRPIAPVRRVYALGQQVRALTDSFGDRIGFIATGGLSHWPPVWNERSDQDDPMLQRMKRFQTQGLSVLEDDPELWTDIGAYEIEMAEKNAQRLVNEDWDRQFLALLEKGDVEGVLSMTFESVEREAGHGGHEVLNWVALMGAMGGAPAEIVGYEPVLEWICGMAFVKYA
jgi:2,3-dihydroxyphenylpropionate 1,2-dioxygenase